MSSDWQMPRRNDRCGHCARRFDPGDVLQSRLYESVSGYERADYCDGCVPPAGPETVAAWRSRRSESTARRGAGFDRETALSFFRRLAEPTSPEQQQFRFVLGILLWRKKVLRFDRSDRTRDGEVWSFHIVAGDETFELPVPDLDESRLEQLSAQLDGLLSGGFDPLENTEQDSPDALPAPPPAAERADA